LAYYRPLPRLVRLSVTLPLGAGLLVVVFLGGADLTGLIGALFGGAVFTGALLIGVGALLGGGGVLIGCLLGGPLLIGGGVFTVRLLGGSFFLGGFGTVGIAIGRPGGLTGIIVLVGGCGATGIIVLVGGGGVLTVCLVLVFGSGVARPSPIPVKLPGNVSVFILTPGTVPVPGSIGGTSAAGMPVGIVDLRSSICLRIALSSNCGISRSEI